VVGRYWIMDRDKRWERVERGYKLVTAGEGLKFGSAAAAVEDSYRREITDEFIEPSLVTGADGAPLASVTSSDSVFFFNFRADRAREITWALTEQNFEFFPRLEVKPFFTTMTMYQKDMTLPIAFPQNHLTNILGEVLSKAGLKQFRIAETEKYAHVTYFFNGGVETPFPGEDRQLINSPKVATYDLQPKMSAPEVAAKAMEALDKDYSFILLNFANPDMVGHTGVLPAVLQALKALDPLMKGLVEKAVRNGYDVLITADHGNSEQMFDSDGSPHTAHTTNPVNCTLIRADGSKPPLRDGILADVAPTVLQLLGLPQPAEMEGKSLLQAG